MDRTEYNEDFGQQDDSDDIPCKPLEPFQDGIKGPYHPYAPFPGKTLKWASFVYDDGTT